MVQTFLLQIISSCSIFLVLSMPQVIEQSLFLFCLKKEKQLLFLDKINLLSI